MARTLALLIASTEFEDSRLTQLASPTADVTNLAQILESPEYGQFDGVQTLINKPHVVVRREMWKFLMAADRNPDDFVLLYYSGHGILDESGKLYLACSDTLMDLLPPTAVAASDLNSALDQCRSRRQVLILDCCNSGSFKRGSKGPLGASVGTKTALGADANDFRGEGQGRVVLTATDETQYALEGDNISGTAEPSIFTRHLLDGLRTGEADQDGDGWIGVDELYDYVNRHVLHENPKQRPKKFADVRGEFVISRRPRGTEKPVPLTAELIDDLHSTVVPTRLSVVDELVMWLESSHLGKVLASYSALQGIAANDDSIRVQNAAKTALAGHQDAYERALSQQTERITVLTSRRPRPPVTSSQEPPAPEQSAPPETASQPAQARLESTQTPLEPPQTPAQPAQTPLEQPNTPPPLPDSTRDAWMAWALREAGLNLDLARIATESALAAISRGANSEAAAQSARLAIARYRRAGTAQVPAHAGPAEASVHVGMPKSDSGFWFGLVTIVGLIFCGPVSLATVWFTRWSTPAKIIVAGLGGVWSIVAYLLYLASVASRPGG